MLLKTKCANTWNTPLGSAVFPYKFQPSSIYSVCHIWTELQTRGYILIAIFFSGDISKYHTGNALTERVILTRPESRIKEISETNKKYQLLDIPLMTQKMCSRNPSKSISFYIFFLKNQWMTNPKWLTPTWTKLFTLCQKVNK